MHINPKDANSLIFPVILKLQLHLYGTVSIAGKKKKKRNCFPILKTLHRFCLFASPLPRVVTDLGRMVFCVCVCARVRVWDGNLFSKLIESFHLLQRTLKKCTAFFNIQMSVNQNGGSHRTHLSWWVQGHWQDWNGSKSPWLADF